MARGHRGHWDGKPESFQTRGLVLYSPWCCPSRRECGGLIVQSSFSSVKELARRVFPIPLLEYVLKSCFDSLEKIRRVRAPILIVHGTRDEVIPFSMGQRLYQAAPEPKSFFALEGAGHNDVLAVGGKQYLSRMRRFIAGETEQPK